MTLVRGVTREIQEVIPLPVNVKKRSAHNIFLGKDVETGMTKHISEVVSGAKCGCVCAFCLQPLEARKGTQRVHHFAHVTNYDCMYSNEVAIYQRVAEILKEDRLLSVPQVTLQFGNWEEPEILRARQILMLDNVSYRCEPKQYPPELIVYTAGSKLRILIEFSDGYYEKKDLGEFQTEGKEKDYSILLLNMPRLAEGNEGFYTRGHLSKWFTGQDISGRWIRSALEEKMRERYLALVTKPNRIKDRIECPLHLSSGGQEGQFYVGRWVCSRCEYYLEREKCIGASGVRSISDLDLPPKQLQERVKEIQKKNEEDAAESKRRRAENLRLQEEAERQKRKQQERLHTQMLQRFFRQPQDASEYECKADQERERIIASFDPSNPEKTVDFLGRRWIKCERCGEIRLDTEMVEYGGSKGTNLGLCRYCSRNQER